MTAGLPFPALSRGRFVPKDISSDEQTCIYAWTDEALYEACGVRIAFTERSGGLSKAPYDTLNLKVPEFSDTSQEHASPDPNVPANRRLLASALNCTGMPIICPRQVHKDTVVSLHTSEEADIARAFSQASRGADALIMHTTQIGALLCFADCVPLIFVAPAGQFAVVHCGWRGVVLHLAQKAFSQLVDEAQCKPEEVNIYIGPYIHEECFDISFETADIIQREYGSEVFADPNHVNLGHALRMDLQEVGAVSSRIADVDICCACYTTAFFSYRKSGGVCGRHGAFAFRV